MANLDGPLMLVVNSSTIDCFGHDHLFSPVALYNSQGIAIERMEYDAYGRMSYRFTPDINRDGYVTASDLSVLWDNWGGSDFNCDLNRDGSVDYADQQILMQYWGASFSSSSGNYSGNPIGFTGQRRDALDWQAQSGTADAAGLELAYYKNRYFSPELGRFMQCDPPGYVNGMGLYEYARSCPIRYADFLGTCVRREFDYKVNGEINWQEIIEMTPSMSMPDRKEVTVTMEHTIFITRGRDENCGAFIKTTERMGKIWWDSNMPGIPDSFTFGLAGRKWKAIAHYNRF